MKRMSKTDADETMIAAADAMLALVAAGDETRIRALSHFIDCLLRASAQSDFMLKIAEPQA